MNKSSGQKKLQPKIKGSEIFHMTIEYQEDTYEFDGKLVDFNMDITTDYINTSVEYFTNLHAGLRSAFVEMGIQVVGEPVVHRRRA